MLDPFVAHCRLSAKHLLAVTRELSSSSTDVMPQSVRETQARIEQHNALVQDALERQPALVELRQCGEDTLTGIKEYVMTTSAAAGSDDEYRSVSVLVRVLGYRCVELWVAGYSFAGYC